MSPPPLPVRGVTGTIDPDRPWYDQEVYVIDEDEFNAAFEQLAGETMMDFGGAIAAVKAGHRVQRSAWSTAEPGRYIMLAGIDSITDVREGQSVTYSAPPVDQLAEDWNYVRLPDTGDATAGDPLAQRVYQSEGPTIPKEFVEADNVTFVDTASVGPVPVSAGTDQLDPPAHPSQGQHHHLGAGADGDLDNPGGTD